MMTARDFSASTPVSPTTAAIAPNAPTGAAHMIIDRMRKSSRSMWATARTIRSPLPPGRRCLRAERLQCEAGERRDEQRLQHRSLGERGHQRGGDDPEQELDRA